ncbi:hypothetical protein R9X47_01165 [Wukongibacter baidiensis]|uniref:hypothetical protein n=1 Tax=Wukongibacter baidiensis TaxID=1723361 RepID=UPI003D7F9405
MKNNDNRIVLIVLIMAFSFTIFLGGAWSISYAEEKFETDVKIGFDGYVIPNEVTPIRIEIKNNFEDIEGKVQLLYEDKFRGNQTSLYTAYSKRINIAKGSTKIVNIESTFYQNGNLFIRVLDKKDNIVFEKRVQYLNLKKPDDLYMGVFSENTDSLRYLGKTYSKVTHGNGGSSYFKILELDEHIPENYKVLKMFSTIVINNFDSEKLSSGQQEALKKWVESGGLLLIGTGSNYQKTLKGLNEELNFLDVKGTKTIDNSQLSSEESLVLLNAELKTGEKLVINGEEILPIYHQEIGNGNVVITSFDLALSPFGNWDKNDEFMNEVINKYFKGKANEFVGRNIKRNHSYRFDNIVSYLPYNLLPSIKTIVIILILFILLVGPINYFILKKLDKREFIWLTIPLIVILFSGSIYVLGFKTRLRQPIANNVSVINIDSKTNTAEVTARSGLMGFNNGDWDVVFDKQNEVFLQNNRDYDKLQRFANGEIVTEYIFDDQKHIILRKAGVLDVETVSNNYEFKMKDKLSGEFKLVDGAIVGDINNLSDLDLEDAVVFLGNNYRKLGDIKSGDKSKEIKFEMSKVKAYTANARRNWYDLFDAVYGTYRGSRNSNNEDLNDILNPNIKRDILDGVINSNLNSISKNRFFMLAWNRDKIGKGIKINNKEAKTLDRNLVVLPLSIEYKKGDTVTVPYGILYPNIVDIYDMELEDEDQMLYGEGYAVLSFKPEKNMELNSMEINYSINKYRGKHEMYIYNFTTEEWEKTDRSNVLIDASNKTDYYDVNAGTLLKIDPTDHGDLYVPNFTVEGVIK